MEGCGCAYHPDRSYKWPHCRRCGKPAEACAFISRRGRCENCGIGQAITGIRELKAKSGDTYDRYRAGMRAYAATLT